MANDNAFNITPLGASFLSVSQTYNRKSELSCYWPDIINLQPTLDLKSDFHLILALARQGWTYAHQRDWKSQDCARDARVAYCRGGNKIWFFHTNSSKGGINRPYLSVLLDSERLFKLGLRKIYHQQPNSYYSALQEVSLKSPGELNSVLPNQKKAYYTDLIGRKHGRKGNVTKKLKASFLQDIEDEPSNLFV